ncbi:origin recognition complex subunit 2-domain-containing protein [Triangularia verruculosa]|uniref:Origin recognition complex subunit 2 n=1 Tax=Triangularia verruculosa TaxID=2587418 RepID=A0AAN6XP42_9PEZI|nr:origin recognition complex subunit 2-domain-containing protein [Triangularia verruculosa]
MPPKKATNHKPPVRQSRKRQSPSDPYEIPEEDDNQAPKRRRLAKPDPENEQEPTNDAAVSTPSASRLKKTVATPIKLNGLNGVDTPSRKNNADRSARRKSARALVDRVISGAISDDEAEDGDIAREIYESSEDEEDDDEEENQNGETEPTTPSKSAPGRKRKATTSTRARKRSPTPPRDLPPHEQYFYQNKPGLSKTSNNTLSSLQLLTHDEYFSLLRDLAPKNPHKPDISHLQSLHATSFPQWAFELSQGFSTCLYGYGSKRHLLHQFATYLSSNPPCSPTQTNKIVIVNGYTPSFTTRELLSVLSSAISSPPCTSLPPLLSYLSSRPKTTLTVLLNSITSPPLRKSPFQSLLSTLASHPQVYFCCTSDTPDFGLLWDSAQSTSFQFLFHDCTTFAPFSPSELEVVDSVHELLGRKTRRAGGKEGVAFVLRSLPENAKSLFRLLVGEVLCADGGDQQGAAAEEEEVAVEYRMVYNRAVEEFICSSEMAFRTLLKEFHDHQIITSHKDALGTELLSLPFRKEELEGILEELTT